MTSEIQAHDTVCLHQLTKRVLFRKTEVKVATAQESRKMHERCRARPGPVPYVQWAPEAAGAAGPWGCRGTVSTCKTRPTDTRHLFSH